MQTALIVLIVAFAALYWINKFFPRVGIVLWKSLANTLKLLHAPYMTQQWALKHCLVTKSSGCSACSKCSSKCH